MEIAGQDDPVDSLRAEPVQRPVQLSIHVVAVTLATQRHYADLAVVLGVHVELLPPGLVQALGNRAEVVVSGSDENAGDTASEAP